MRILLIGILLSLFVANAYAGDAAVPTFGDWSKACEQVPDQTTDKGKDGTAAAKSDKAAGKKQKICFIYQTISKKDTKQLIMQVRVGFVPEKHEPAMIITVPLGVLLLPGAAMIVDGAKPITFHFMRCGPEGCFTLAEPLDKDHLDAMRKGKGAFVNVAIGVNRETHKLEPLSIPISLKGFARAYNSIEPK